jgi:transcriptional regulator with PAS, ATPase and Fis domain
MFKVALNLCQGECGDFARMVEGMFASVRQGVLLMDARHCVRYVNQAFRKATGALAHERSRPPRFVEELTDIVLRDKKNVRGAHYLIDPPERGQTGKIRLTVSATSLCLNREMLALLVIEERSEDRGERETSFHGMVGHHASLERVFALIRDAAPLDVPVLIQGETGTGKEMIAEAIHRESRRANRQLVVVNCSALAESLLESELFGHVKGAFTGASRDYVGRFELAHRGTIFLDEIGEMSPSMQVRLLRVLQDGTLERVGEGRTRRVDARLICATNRHLQEEVARGNFRADLYYRLGVVIVECPPLRERQEDIRELASYLLASASKEYGIPVPLLAPETLKALLNYHWPGNVRELENCLRYALIKTHGHMILPRHLPDSLLFKAETPRPGRKVLDEKEVTHALQAAGGDKSRAAALLGISRASLYRFLSQHTKT